MKVQRWRLMLVAMLSLGILLWLSVAVASAEPLQVTIQPIQVCNNAGLNCANAARQLFEPEGDKIWAQADIDLLFLPWLTLNSTAHLTNPNIFTIPEPPGIVDPLVIRMWFVDTIAGAFGVALLNANRTLIANSVFTFNGGIGRRDTISHELGHNLNLGHTPGTAAFAKRLLAPGNVRLIPSSVADIFPDGAQLDQLIAAEITTARASRFARPQRVPEPATLSLLGTGLLAVFGLSARRRNMSRRCAA